MKKLVLISLLSTLLVSCSTKSSENENVSNDLQQTYQDCLQKDPAKLEHKELNNIKNDYLDAFLNINNILSEAMFIEGHDNLVYSPLSLYMGLSLLNEGASGNTRELIDDFLNIGYEDNASLCNSLISNVNFNYEGLSRELTNSIWLNNNASFNESTLNNLANNYECYPFSIDFSKDNANKLVRDFIFEKTHEIIDYTPNYNKDTLLSIINTLYFHDGFAGKLQQTKEKYTFKNSDGSEKEINLLQSNSNKGAIFENELYSQFYIKTSHNQKITFVLPKDGHNVDEILKDEILDDIITCQYEKTDTNKSIVLFPSFEANYNESLKESLTSLGLGDIFNKTDLSNLTSYPCLVDDIVHVANIKVDEKGVTAAAATIIDDKMTEAQDSYEINTLVLDRPFAFIVQTEENLPLFVGAVKKI